MKNSMSRRLLAPILGLFLLSGCVREAPNLALIPADDLYAQGTQAYQAERYGRAAEYLEAFVINHLGDPRAPEARLLLARSYMERGEELTAIMHYQRLVNDFPSSPLQLDARFGICEAYYDLSPRPQLDQEYTRSALLHCESIGQYYPDTEQAEIASRHVAQLRHKLAEKLYQTGIYYRDRRVFDAAVVYLEDVVTEYPQTAVAPAALARLVETYTRMGYVEDAADARQRLLTNYPESAEARAMREGASG
jgi:outer membrane protein assembly factor BamD